MSLSWMQRIDQWLGTPLAWALGWITRPALSLGGDDRPEDRKLPKRVVVAKFIGLGSVVLSLPLLRALKDQGIHVAFWAFPAQAEFVRMTGLADEVWVVRPTLRSFLPTLLGTMLRARRARADAFLDLEPTANFSALLARLSGAKRRVGFMCGKPQREALFSHLVALTANRHMAENALWMARLLGVPTPAGTALPPVPASVLKSRSDLAKRQSTRRIVININTSDMGRYHRMWPEAHWAAVCSKLLADSSVELVFPGVRSERRQVESLLSRIGAPEGRVRNIAGETTLPELMQVLRDADLVVSVDSGIMHLAAWAGAPLVSLFGPETPALYAPISDRSKVLWAGLPCSPCCTVATEKHTRCRDNVCMKEIRPEQVSLACSALEQELAKRAGRTPLKAA